MDQKLLFKNHGDTAAEIDGTQFADGGKDGKHYWLTPPDLMKRLDDRFQFDCDACPMKRGCCPKAPSRKVPRDIDEDVRDHVRALANP